MSKSWADPLTLGKYLLKNRVFMSAMTRTRCDVDGIPNELLVEYYTQRSGAGLILTEANSWSKRGQGFPRAANLYTVEQAEGWKKVVDAVHDKGSRIFVQLCHCGRATDPLINGGLQTWAPSAIAVRQEKSSITKNTYPVPKAVTLEDIQVIQAEFEESVKLALKAGFDGIQLHGAFGYLIDQFIRSYTNQRTDAYGGNEVNRARFVLQLIDIALKYLEPHQIGIKLSPTTRGLDMYDQNPVQTYGYLLSQLDKRNIGFVELAEVRVQVNNPHLNLHPKQPKEQIEEVAKTLRPFFFGVIVGNNGYTPESGLQQINASVIDAVTFGRYYICNPDLAERIIAGVQINKKFDYPTFTGNNGTNGPKGYIDYAAYDVKL